MRKEKVMPEKNRAFYYVKYLHKSLILSNFAVLLRPIAGREALNVLILRCLVVFIGVRSDMK